MARLESRFKKQIIEEKIPMNVVPNFPSEEYAKEVDKILLNEEKLNLRNYHLTKYGN